MTSEKVRINGEELNRMKLNGELLIGIKEITLVNEDDPSAECRARIKLENGDTLYLLREEVAEYDEIKIKYLLRIQEGLELLMSYEEGERFIEKLEVIKYE